MDYLAPFEACHPIHTLLDIVPVKRNAVITRGEIQHRPDLIRSRSVNVGVVALNFSENDRMLEQLVHVIQRKHVHWSVQYSKVGAKAVSTAVTKALDYGLDTNVLSRVAVLDEMPDRFDTETLLAGS